MKYKKKDGKSKRLAMMKGDKNRTIMLDEEDRPVAVFQVMTTNQLRGEGEPNQTPASNTVVRDQTTTAKITEKEDFAEPE